MRSTQHFGWRIGEGPCRCSSGQSPVGVCSLSLPDRTFTEGFHFQAQAWPNVALDVAGHFPHLAIDERIEYYDIGKARLVLGLHGAWTQAPTGNRSSNPLPQQTVDDSG